MSSAQDPGLRTSRAIVFPGQGAQYAGMGLANAERFAAARAVFEEADSVLGFALSRTCFEGPQADLDRTDTSQPAIYVASCASLAAYRERHGQLPDAALTAGLSLGEYTALHFAGALSFADGLRLVRARGEAMQAACDAEPSGMVSVIGLARAALEEVCREAAARGVICLANVNSPEQIAISGSKPALEAASELARARGAKRAIPLAVAGAFHSPLMRPARDRLAEAVARVEIRAPRIPVVSNVTARETTDPARIRELLLEQLTSPVEWVRSVERMWELGAREFVEIGPQKVLTGLLRRIQREATGSSVDEVEKG